MEMEAELEDVNRELKNHKLNVFADACDKAGQKIEQFGKRMTVVSAGLATFATASAKMAVDFEDSTHSINIMDEGVMSVDEMEDAIIGLSNETGIAAGDIADNVYNAISAGQDTAEPPLSVSHSLLNRRKTPWKPWRKPDTFSTRYKARPSRWEIAGGSKVRCPRWC